MSLFPESICPLCSRVLALELLRNHIAFEDPRVRQSTIKVIQAYHPSWVEDHGACEPCWRSYRDAVQIVAAWLWPFLPRQAREPSRLRGGLRNISTHTPPPANRRGECLTAT